MKPFHSQPIDMKTLSLLYLLNSHIIHISVRLTTVLGRIIWNSRLAWFVISYIEC